MGLLGIRNKCRPGYNRVADDIRQRGYQAVGVFARVPHRWIVEHTRVSPGILDFVSSRSKSKPVYERSVKPISIRSVGWGKYLNSSLRLFNHQMSWQISSQEVCLRHFVPSDN